MGSIVEAAIYEYIGKFFLIFVVVPVGIMVLGYIICIRDEQNSDLLMRLYNKWCHLTCLEPIYCDSTLQNSRFAQPL